ncbi:hypothetical protein OCC_11482 [Thermococcus litoralis DSM 5473]|uniref:DUF4276 family protein n=1 Tax=Thermococcus litoralis (strain ATCC 51850 / DSM 5473 / JCM 8560 / NS-C) TaxID=523849 RepID=H3ZND7_THELN|nr:DUF3226 domain-containing protein [Thermococcus litoralis]EHR78561.1 hypothetical protein OCC_11482 [Thermococcus litoralis DSM 5473]
MEVRLLLLEGRTDVSFFLPLIKEFYRFRESNAGCEILPFSKDKELSRPICLIKYKTLLVILHANGKDNLKKALKAVFRAVERFEDRPTIIGVARDVDTEENILNWAKSTLQAGGFEPEVKNGYLLVNGITIVPFGIGDVTFDAKDIEPKKELELLMTLLAKKESNLSRLENSISQLSKDLERKLTPKDVMHLLAIARNYKGDSMSGLYRNFIEKLIRENRGLIEEFLDESGLRTFLETIAR